MESRNLLRLFVWEQHVFQENMLINASLKECASKNAQVAFIKTLQTTLIQNKEKTNKVTLKLSL